MGVESSNPAIYEILNILKFSIVLTGLYENFAQLPAILKDCKLEEIYVKTAFHDTKALILHNFIYDESKNAVYTEINYESVRRIFYTNGVENNELLEVLYKCGYYRFKSEQKEYDENVRFVGLYEDNGHTMKLKTNRHNLYINLIGRAISRTFILLRFSSMRDRILDFTLNNPSDFPLCYFKSYDDCLEELKYIVRNSVEVIGKNYRDNCAKFMSYYGRRYKPKILKKVTISDFIEANEMVVDLCNLIERIYNCSPVDNSSFVKCHLVEEDLINFYRSICFKFEFPISHSKEDCETLFEIMTFNIDKKRIYPQDLLYKNISNKIIIPIEYLLKNNVSYIEIKLGVKTTGLVSISEFFILK